MNERPEEVSPPPFTPDELRTRRQASRLSQKQLAQLLAASQEAAELYLALLAREGNGRGGRTSGPLFVGYNGERITPQGFYERERKLGKLAGIPNLSPHDLRKFFAKNTFERGNAINVIQRYGGWRSGHMPLHYGKLYGQETGVLKVGTEKKEAGEKE